MALSTTRTLLTQTGINTHQVFNVGGLNSSGVITATSFVGSGANLTGVASTDNIKTSTTANFSDGIQVGGSTTLTGALSATTATANLIVVGSAVTSNSQGIDVTGVITATTFKGDGSNLTGIDADRIIEGNSYAEVLDTGSNGIFRFLPEGTEKFRITTDGKVGIGTNNPGNPLEVWGSSADLLICDTDAYSQNSTGAAVAFQGQDSAGNRKTLADIRGVSNGANVGEFAIRTRRSGGTLTEALRVTSEGKIGIGTNNPTGATGPKIHIENDGNLQIKIDCNTTSANTDECGVLFSASGDNKSHIGLSVDSGRMVSDAQASDTVVKTIGTAAIRLATDSTTRCVIEGSSGITNFQKAVGIGSYTTTQRNAIAYLQSGTLIFNNTTGTVQIWDGGSWTNLTDPFSASGGTKTTSGSKTIHTFTSNGTFTVASNATNVRALIVGGGGGGGGRGGNDGSGGGGGGLVRFVTAIPVSSSPGSYPIVIGGGGSGRGPGTNGGDGGSSSAFSNTSPGGGGGGSEAPGPRAGRAGGCGGGGGGFGGGGGTGSGDPGAPTDTDLETDGNTPSNGWGNDGGANAYPGGMNYGGGGGGGAQHYGMPGKNPNSVPTQYAMHTYSGNGGNGVGYSISGSPAHYAGGGGCGGNAHHGNNGPGAYGGRGGGGNGGGGPFGSANSGTGGTGSGGGGAAAANSPAPNHNSGAGGGGIVIIDYDTP